ncbi:hypothetical protein PVL29_004211 [Vitis rotundifolia]|uniref:Beta-adaptin appendage C-terminal subdomain domain-containing protein n=1 Tax=Vitis rotundifolia TaxID=103349 RepID=A0AA39E049_VITRO|nr:hypothetical protein PVL29_004211 [Vitis rotundifolia]
MAPPAQSQRSPSPSQPSGKGEVSDLKLQLRQHAGSRAPGADDAKRELFKKVISYMTIGIDVSSLFGEMVMCSVTSDIVLKKMCYLYVGNYAKGNPDLALLTINFLQKDCKDEDPMIRGLALRSLCSLRVTNLVEYLVGPLGSGLKDSNSYVRMVAASAVLKLYHISASTCVDADFPAMLKHLMLNDPDTQVVANCLSSLQEIWSSEASTSEEASREREALLSKPVIYYFLNRIKEFSEWAQCLVLELVANYVPSDNSEIFDIMNLLEDRLQHANGAVVLATIKVFLQLTLSMADVHQQVYERIKAPLLTLVSSGSQEQSYAVLSHLHLLVMRAPILFSSDYKHFYCQYNEPSYVKKLKLEMLTAVANESNTYEIVTELCEYAANVDIPIARESIRAVGKIALQQYDVNAIVDRLLQFLEMEKDYVTAETLVLVKDLLRKYPQWSHDCIAVVGNISSKNVQEPKAKAALIWMLGEYSQDMHDAPYVLESLVDNWDDEHSAEVRLHLLTAVLKCFLKRPPETQKALGAALAAGLADFHQDVHDRALFYYRLLQHNVSVAERVVNPPKQAVSVFADTQSSEVKDRIFDEFNSLSVVYQKPSYMFTDKEHRGPFEFSDELGSLSIGADSADNVVPAQRVEANDKDLLLSTSEKEESRGATNNGSAYNAPMYDGTSVPTGASQLQSELAISNTMVPSHSPSTSLAVDDLLGLGVPLSPASPPPPPPPPPPLKLNEKAVLDPSTFQQKWRQLPISLSQDYSMSPQGVAALTRPQAFLRHMQGHSIHCIASGGQAPNFKFFFFAQKAEELSTFLVECIINTSSAKAQIKIKADDQNRSLSLSLSAQLNIGIPQRSQRLFCNKPLASNPLLIKLLQESISRIKTVLDSEDNFTFKSSDFSWDILLTTLKSSSSAKAHLVLEWRLEKMVRDNERDLVPYLELIFLCSKVQNVPFAMQVFNSMEAHGIELTSSVFNALIYTCLSSGNVMTALSLFEIMQSSENCKPNSETYNTFISVYSNLGNDKAMQAWYFAKKGAGFSADLRTYESLISGCVRSRNFDRADRFYEEMMLSGIMPNGQILENILTGLCEQRSISKVEQLLKFMMDGEWEISVLMAEKLMGLYFEHGTVEKMEELLLNLMNLNRSFEVLQQVHCGIIRMHAMLDRLDDMEYSVGRMLKQGMSFRCPDDIEKVVCAYFRREAYDRLDLFLGHIKGSYKLTKSTYDLLVAGYRRAGLSEKLDLVMDGMKLAGFF